MSAFDPVKVALMVTVPDAQPLMERSAFRSARAALVGRGLRSDRLMPASEAVSVSEKAPYAHAPYLGHVLARTGPPYAPELADSLRSSLFGSWALFMHKFGCGSAQILSSWKTALFRADLRNPPESLGLGFVL